VNKILAILIAVMFVFIYLIADLKKRSDVNFKEAIAHIERQNDSLLKSIEQDKKEIEKFNRRVDSLEEVKNKIIVKYKFKENEIDKSSSAHLVNEFKDIFAGCGIK
jgi:predicted RNase H-like nuclease (RuvC/YqgF family)